MKKLTWAAASLLFLFLFILSVFLYSKELSVFTNTFNSQTLVLISLFIGLVIGVGIAFYASKVEEKILDKIKIYAMIIASCLYLSPLLGSMMNRAFFTKETNKSFLIHSNFNRTSTLASFVHDLEDDREAHYFLIRNRRIERVKKTGMEEREYKIGESITFNVRKGLFGFEYVPYN